MTKLRFKLRALASRIGRSALGAKPALPILAAIVLVALPGFSQTSSSSSGGDYSTFEISPFAGGQWFQLYQGSRVRVHQFAPGGVFGFHLNQDLWEHFGLEETFSNGYNNVRLQVYQDPNQFWFGAAVRNYTFTVGPVLYLTRRESKLRPFLYAGPGVTFFKPKLGAWQAVGGPAIGGIEMRYGPSLVYGLGVKYNAWRRLGFRVDVRDTYSQTPHFGLPSFTTTPAGLYIPSHGTEHALSATLGVVFRFGSKEAPAPPPPTPAPAPAAAPAPAPAPAPRAEIRMAPISGAHDACPGDDVTLTANASGWPSDQTPTYQWAINGQPVSGANGSTFSVPTQGRQAGALRITVTVSAGGSSATSDPATVNIRPYAPPTVQLSANPTTIPAGGTATLNGTARTSDCAGGQATIRYSASEGTVTGNTFNSNGVSFDMSNRSKPQSKVVHLTATATDPKGGTGTATTDVTVTLTAQAQRLDDIVYPANSARVNNCAKRLLLEQLTPMLRDDPNAKVVFIGHRDASERGANLDRTRVLNAAAVISAGSGICPQLELSRVKVAYVGTNQSSATRPSLCGTSTNVKERGGQSISGSDTRAQFRRVEIWFVPGGAEMPAGVSATDAPEPQIKALGCPR